MVFNLQTTLPHNKSSINIPYKCCCQSLFLISQTVCDIKNWFLHNPYILVSLSWYRNPYVFVFYGTVYNKNPIFLFCINPYQFQMFGILWKITERDFIDPYLPNGHMSVHLTNWIFSNDLFLVLKNIIKFFTWTSGCIKFTNRIIFFI